MVQVTCWNLYYLLISACWPEEGVPLFNFVSFRFVFNAWSWGRATSPPPPISQKMCLIAFRCFRCAMTVRFHQLADTHKTNNTSTRCCMVFLQLSLFVVLLLLVSWPSVCRMVLNSTIVAPIRIYKRLQRQCCENVQIDKSCGRKNRDRSMMFRMTVRLDR